MARRRAVKLTQALPDRPILGRLEAFARTPSGRIKQYRDPITGNVYSQRHVQQARQGGFSPEAAAKARRAGFGDVVEHAKKGGSEAVARYARLYGERRGVAPGKAQEQERLWKLLRDLRSASNAPNGRKARALVALGLRPAGAPWRVGDSPKKRNQPRAEHTKTGRRGR